MRRNIARWESAPRGCASRCCHVQGAVSFFTLLYNPSPSYSVTFTAVRSTQNRRHARLLLRFCVLVLPVLPGFQEYKATLSVLFFK